MSQRLFTVMPMCGPYILNGGRAKSDRKLHRADAGVYRTRRDGRRHRFDPIGCGMVSSRADGNAVESLSWIRRRQLRLWRPPDVSYTPAMAFWVTGRPAGGLSDDPRRAPVKRYKRQSSAGERKCCPVMTAFFQQCALRYDHRDPVNDSPVVDLNGAAAGSDAAVSSRNPRRSRSAHLRPLRIRIRHHPSLHATLVARPDGDAFESLYSMRAPPLPHDRGSDRFLHSVYRSSLRHGSASQARIRHPDGVPTMLRRHPPPSDAKWTWSEHGTPIARASCDDQRLRLLRPL